MDESNCNRTKFHPYLRVVILAKAWPVHLIPIDVSYWGITMTDGICLINYWQVHHLRGIQFSYFFN